MNIKQFGWQNTTLCDIIAHWKCIWNTIIPYITLDFYNDLSETVKLALQDTALHIALV